jgi:outer membrane protein assembly factor BamB
MRTTLTTSGSLALLLFLTGCSHSTPMMAAPTVETPQSVAADPPAAAKPATSAATVQLASAAEKLATRKTGDDWPIFLGPSQDSRSPEKGIITKWGDSGLKLVWHAKLGTSYGAPTIAGGRLLQLDRFGDKSRLYCLNAETGHELWRYEFPTEYEDLYQYNNGPRCSPVIDGELVYAYSVDGVLTCCRVADGQPLWQKNLNQEFGVIQNFFGVGSTPVVEGDLIIAMVGGSPPESKKVSPGQLDKVDPNGSGIVALDKLTGEVKYKIADELASYASLRLAMIDGRRWCFAFCRGGLVAFEPGTGKIDFHYPWRDKQLESVNASMPVVVGDEVLISETYGIGSSLLKVSPGKYEVVWKDDDRKRAKAMQTHWNTPIYEAGHLFGCSGRHTENATLRCIEWNTGKVLWDQPSMARTSLLAIDRHFLCLGEFGQLWLLKLSPEKPDLVAVTDYADPAIGQKLLGKSGPVLEYPCWAAPVVSHGLLYVRGKDRLLCLELIPK